MTSATGSSGRPEQPPRIRSTAGAPPDAFFARLAELLPDVDIVVLPPEERVDPGEPRGAEESWRAAHEGADRALAALRRWWPVVVPDLAQPATISCAWSPSADGRHVQARAEARTEIDRGAERRRLLEASRDGAVAEGAQVVLERAAVGLLRLHADGVLIEVHSPPDVPWCAVGASVLDIDVGECSVALLTADPIETPWKQRSGCGC